MTATNVSTKYSMHIFYTIMLKKKEINLLFFSYRITIIFMLTLLLFSSNYILTNCELLCADMQKIEIITHEQNGKIKMPI